MNKISIVLADDHQVVREGLRRLLEGEPDFDVVGEAGGGVEAIQVVEALKPTVLILDMMMRDMNGIEVTRQVRKRVPQTQIVILSMHSNEAYVLEALRAGAGGYVLKESSSDDLAHAVRQVVEGRRYLSSPLSERAIEVYTQSIERDTLDPYETLTDREREVLYMVAQGYTSSEIAERLYISQRTVETHRTNLMHKLDLRNHTHLIRYALQRGIIPSDE